ncbi:biotin/lipoyl-containing protein, partial [Bacillus pumilus]
VQEKIKADRSNPNHIAASMPGTVSQVLVENGQKISQGEQLMINEAMKMETTEQAPFTAVVDVVHVTNREPPQTGDLVIV